MLSTYFKEREGFKRLLTALKEKYISLGRYKGSVKLENITEDESMTFTNFFGKKFEKGQTVTIKFQDIERTLKNTPYKNFSWEELFTSYFEENILDNKTKKQRELEQEETFYENLQERLKEEEKEFLKRIREEKQLQILLTKRYKKERDFKETLIWIITLIYKIEEEVPTTLAMFASITRNPHFLDLKTANMSLFLKLLSFKLEVEEPKTTSEKIEFLQKLGISIDTVSNYVITYKLKSSSNLVTAFLEEKEILNLNLSNLQKIKDLDTEEKIVFVFENPSLITELKYLEVPIIITSGNTNLCVIEVLKKLDKSNNTIYYNGDFDPEGLLNAQNIKKKIPSIKFFCYEKEDYQYTISEEKISTTRLKKLNGIEYKPLEDIKNQLLTYKKAAYQEKNKERICKKIKEIGEKIYIK